MKPEARKTSIENKNIHFVGSIITYEDLRENSEYVIHLFTEAINEFTIGEIKPCYFAVYFVKGNVKIYKFRKRNFNRIAELLRKKELEAVTLEFSDKEYTEDNVIFSDASVCIVLCKKQIEEPHSPFKFFKNGISFSISASLYCDKLSFLKQWIKNIFINVEGISGHMECLYRVVLGGMLHPTSYEEISDKNALLLGDYTKRLRGYFYFTVLTQAHIDILGGKEYVKTNMPVFNIDEAHMNDGSVTFFCELSDNVAEFDKDKYKKLKGFLKPLLVDEDMRYEVMEGREKGTADARRLVFSEKQLNELDELNQRNIAEIKKEIVIKMEKELKAALNKKAQNNGT